MSLNYKKIEEAIAVSDEMPPAEFRLWLEEYCADDFMLKAEIESLLAFETQADKFLEKPVGSLAADILPEENEIDFTGKQFGHYKIIKEIGRGGMGAVFLAERSDGEFSQKVAVKIVRQTLIDKETARRFKKERQILANLNHPNIAKLLDGGVSASGEPFLVMEFIEGETLTEFAENNNLNTNERLQIFQKICSAVAYAHRNLIVHRDIKPSNILVTKTGEPKLLDFGLAKAFDETLADENQTQTGFRAMTPAYASPEQIRGETVTTTSDIYSLGKVLSELLGFEKAVSQTPISAKKTVKDLHTTQADQPNRKLQIANRKSKDDLQNITAMALREEPERRYQSVEAFVDDIENYLKGLPVAARPATVSYRASKFIKRNKSAVAAASLILITLVIGIIATVWQAQAAQREKEKAEKVSAFLSQMLKYSNPIYKSLQKGGQEATINDVLDEALRRIKQGEFDSSPEVKAELLRTISASYFGQGKRELAKELMTEYVALGNRIYPENSPKRIETSIISASLLFNNDELSASEKLYRETLPRMREEQKRGNIEAEILADALNNFAYLRRTQGDSSEAETLFREALALNEKMSADEANLVNGATRSVLASTLADQGRFDEALQTSHEAVEEQRRNNFSQTPTFGFNLTVLGGFLTEKGEFAEADKNLQEAENIFRKNMQPTSLWLGDNLRNQAISLYFQSKYSESIRKADETLKIYLTFGKHYDQYPTVLIYKGLSLAKSGRLSEGEKLLREAVEIRRKSLPKEHFWVALAESALGEVLMLEKRYEEAELLLSESSESLKRSQGAENPRTILAQNRLNQLYEIWKKSER